MKYKEWDIEYNPKPIPDRRFDYDAVHPDYDGADGGNGLAFNAESIEEAKKQIDEMTCDVCQDIIDEDECECRDCCEFVHYECGANYNSGFVCNNCRKYD